jgi:hypothetical protein
MIMRTPIVAIVSLLLLAPAPSAFAESGQPDQKNAPSHPSFSQEQVRQDHPEWFCEPRAYRPCEANVVFRNGRSACLNGGY